MKKILFIICLIISTSSFGQDSSRLKPDITLQARDCEILLFLTKTNHSQKFEDLDSVLLSKWRPPANNPTGTTPVTISGVESRAWLEIWRLCYDFPAIVQNGTSDRIGTVLKASGHSWLASRVISTENTSNDIWVSLRRIGREYGKKETTGFE